MMKLIAIAIAITCATPVASSTVLVPFEKPTKMRDARNAMLLMLGLAITATIVHRLRMHRI